MIFYFTGTGNSMYAAEKLDSEVMSIPQMMKSRRFDFKAERIGIVCPVYGHEMPNMVKEFIGKAEFNTDYFFIILTYGKRHCNAVELAQKALEASGKKADYIATMLMVDNFLPVFDMNEETSLDKAVDKQLDVIRKNIENKTHSIEKVTLKDRTTHNIFMASLRKMIGKNPPETLWADFKITDACIGCGICTKVCPSGCITLKNQVAIHSGNGCQACYACIHACPKMAIQFNSNEKNSRARYRNEHITLAQIIEANNQTDS